MKSLRKFAVLAACLISVAAFAADPSGTWTWVQQGGRRGGGGGGGGTPPPTTLVLALKDGNLTGKLTSPGRQGGEPTTTEITNATFKDDTVTFSLEREFNGNKFVTKYSGKLAGDTITGTREQPGRDGGAPTPVEWVAKKSK